MQSDLEVLILQHPLEVVQAKNTGRLLHLSLASSRILVGEAFDAPVLAPKTTLLLYPSETFQGHLPAAVLPDLSCELAVNLRLVVLDATWRKSRKMLLLNPLLQRLPRLALSDTPASRYLIRKAYRPDQLSTLEATCVALAQLDGGPAPFVPLLAALDGFVAEQLGRQGGAEWCGNVIERGHLLQKMPPMTDILD